MDRPVFGRVKKRPDWLASRAFCLVELKAACAIRGNLDRRVRAGARNSVNLVAWATVVAIFDAGDNPGYKNVSTESGACWGG